jgi:hypothetical protein
LLTEMNFEFNCSFSYEMRQFLSYVICPVTEAKLSLRMCVKSHKSPLQQLNTMSIASHC